MSLKRPRRWASCGTSGTPPSSPFSARPERRSTQFLMRHPDSSFVQLCWARLIREIRFLAEHTAGSCLSLASVSPCKIRTRFEFVTTLALFGLSAAVFEGPAAVKSGKRQSMSIGDFRAITRRRLPGLAVRPRRHAARTGRSASSAGGCRWRPHHSFCRQLIGSQPEAGTRPSR